MRIVKAPAAGGASAHVIVDSGSVSVSNFPATQPISSTDGAQATIGVTTAAAVTTDVAGTVQQYLRGLVKLIAGGIAVSWASAQHVIVDTAPSTAVTNANLDTPLSTLDTDIKTNVTLHAGTNLIGHVISDAGSVVSATIATDSAGLAKDASLTTVNTNLGTIDTDIKAQAKLTDTQPVSVASLPLPTGAALDSSLTTANANLTTLDTDIKQLTTNAAPLPWFMAGQGTFFATGS